MRFVAIFVSLASFASLAPAAFAGEYAVLASGARMHVDRHETAHETTGDKVRLYMGDSFAEMGAASPEAVGWRTGSSGEDFFLRLRRSLELLEACRCLRCVDEGDDGRHPRIVLGTQIRV